MNYKNFSTEDFIQDEFFQQWVYAPNEEKSRYWETFLLHYPSQAEKMEDARQFLLSMKFQRTVPQSIVETIKFNFNNAIDRLEATQKDATLFPARQGHPKRRRSLYVKLFYPVAATLFLLALFIGYLRMQEDGILTVLQTLALEEQETPKGRQIHITLEDGTNVWLNADSKLKYTKNFNTREIREVFLEGEAFFDVAENKDKPFIVHTAGLAIKVLGTAFNVRSYSEDHTIETTLVRGKVSIIARTKNHTQPVTLLPNQQALFRKDSGKIVLEEATNTEDYTSWKNGWIIFDDKPFSYIKETMERWYNVTIMIEDENSLACPFSAKFNNKTLQEVLEIFKTTESINYRIEGNKVFIEGKLCE